MLSMKYLNIVSENFNPFANVLDEYQYKTHVIITLFEGRSCFFVRK